MSTPNQIEANRQNAQFSTGPRTEEGKRRSSFNAVKTGLTGRTILLDSDCQAAYEAHVATFVARYEPATEEERKLVQSIADSEWRLLRIPVLEANLYALGRAEFANLFPDEQEDVRRALIEAKTHATYDRTLSNLSVQENRLARKLEKDRTTLRQIQVARTARHQKELQEAVAQFFDYPDRKRHLNYWRANGFEFTRDEWANEVAMHYVTDNWSPYPQMHYRQALTYFNSLAWEEMTA